MTALRHRQIARGGSPISRQRPQIAGLRDRVALMRALKARRGGLLSLERRAPTDVTAGLVLSWIDAVPEVAITRGLITIGSSLVAVRARLVSLTARLITVCERLLSLAAASVCSLAASVCSLAASVCSLAASVCSSSSPRGAGVAVMQSLDRPVGGFLGTVT